ncbi:hypothetical protein [Priestia megaterium]|uniref:hypothetical protein n=1 Tax=Priestia megaterium TaxID=1404 RepID=UPI0011453886
MFFYIAADFHATLCFLLVPQASSSCTDKSRYIHETYAHHINKKIRTIHRSDLPLTNILLFQPV